MPLSTLEAHVLSLLTAAIGIAVGFGFFGETTEQVIISGAGVVIAALFQIANVLHLKVTSGASRRNAGVK